jgi:hypothetical protein
MAIAYPEAPDARAVFAGRCVVEDADALLEWLRRTPEPEADLAGCTDLHTALAQLLLAARARIVAPPADRMLASCLGVPGGSDAGSPAEGEAAPGIGMTDGSAAAGSAATGLVEAESAGAGPAASGSVGAGSAASGSAGAEAAASGSVGVGSAGVGSAGVGSAGAGSAGGRRPRRAGGRQGGAG